MKKLENQRFAFFQIGLVLALSFSLLAFEWQTYTTQIKSTPLIITDYLPQTPVLYEPTLKKPKVKINTKVDVTLPPTITKDIVKKVEFIDDNNILSTDSLWQTETFTTTKQKPPAKKIAGYDADTQPYLCNCADITDKTKREECTENGIMNSLKNYLIVPKIWKATGQDKATAFVRFLITDKGKVAEVVVGNETLIHPSLVKESIKAIEQLPCFQPGTKDGEKVQVYYSLPIIFKLN